MSDESEKVPSYKFGTGHPVRVRLSGEILKDGQYTTPINSVLCLTTPAAQDMIRQLEQVLRECQCGKCYGSGQFREHLTNAEGRYNPITRRSEPVFGPLQTCDRCQGRGWLL